MSETTKKTPAKKLLEKFGKYSKNEMALRRDTTEEIVKSILVELGINPKTMVKYDNEPCLLVSIISEVLADMSWREGQYQIEAILDDAVHDYAFGSDRVKGFEKSLDLFRALGRRLGGVKNCSGRPRSGKSIIVNKTDLNGNIL